MYVNVGRGDRSAWCWGFVLLGPHTTDDLDLPRGSLPCIHPVYTCDSHPTSLLYPHGSIQPSSIGWGRLHMYMRWCKTLVYLDILASSLLFIYFSIPFSSDPSIAVSLCLSIFPLVHTAGDLPRPQGWKCLGSSSLSRWVSAGTRWVGGSGRWRWMSMPSITTPACSMSPWPLSSATSTAG